MTDRGAHLLAIMILLAESPGPAFVAGHTAFETLGPVIEHVGTPAFVAALGQFTRRFAAFDSLHVLRLTPQHGTSGKPRAEWFGSHVDVCEQDHQRDIMRLYMHRFAERDPVMTRVPAPDSVEVIQRSAAGTNDRELCEAIFEPRQFREECVLLKTVSGAHYSISLSRSRRMPSFSLSEMARIRLLGDVLLPLAALHAQQVTGPGPSHRHADVPDLLTARLAQIGAALSERERAVCAALVRGDTYAAIAEAMEIRKSSVETYARRALVKLGVSSRRDLLAWLHETG